MGLQIICWKLARTESARAKHNMMEELKKAHEGKRVDDGITFDTDKFVYTATDGSA